MQSLATESGSQPSLTSLDEIGFSSIPTREMLTERIHQELIESGNTYNGILDIEKVQSKDEVLNLGITISKHYRENESFRKLMALKITSELSSSKLTELYGNLPNTKLSDLKTEETCLDCMISGENLNEDLQPLALTLIVNDESKIYYRSLESMFDQFKLTGEMMCPVQLTNIGISIEQFTQLLNGKAVLGVTISRIDKHSNSLFTQSRFKKNSNTMKLMVVSFLSA